MDSVNILLTISATFNLGLGFYVYIQRKKNPVNIAFSLITLSVFSWTIAMIAFRWSGTYLSALWWCRILYFFPVFIAPSLLYFSLVFQRIEVKIKKSEIFLIYLFPFIIGALSFVPNFIINNVVLRHGAEKEIYFGAGYPIYFVFYFVYFSWTFFNFLKKLNQADILGKKQMRWVILATFTPVTTGLVTNLILPWGFIFSYNWIAQASAIFFIAGIAYAIVKYQLMNIKLIVAQIISLFLISILFINIFSFDSSWRLMVNLGVFLLGLVFSATLIRSVIAEMNQKEEIQGLASNLKKANDELKKLDEIKSEFISIASHQLRTPLSAIKGYAAMLLDDVQDPEEKEALNKIYLSNERLIKLVNDLLNLSRIERGKLEFIFRPCQLADLLDSVVSEFQMIAKRRGLKLTYEKVNLPFITADEDKLRQVFLNIIDNAIKYTLKGSVTVKTLLDNDSVVVAIQDTGVGMKPEDQKPVYEKFQRGKTSAVVNPDGTGIGLYIANKITEAHHGRIWSESYGINLGTTFYVKLPLTSDKLSSWA
jgi:signal transduction histidine kinase